MEAAVAQSQSQAQEPDPRSKSPPTQSIVDPDRPSTPQQHSPDAARITAAPSPDSEPTLHSLNSHCLSVLAPEQAISRILHDWFDKIHPLAPIVLHRRFMTRLEKGDANTDPDFCGLVVSICAATAATFPRENYGLVTVKRCLDFIDQHRLVGSGISLPTYTVTWCITMYNIGVSIPAISQSNIADRRSFHVLSEAAAGIRYLAYYRQPELDPVETQMLRRLFWLQFASASSADIFGKLSVSLSAHGEDWFLSRPLEVTDEQLEQSLGIELGEAQWHGHRANYIAGLNALCDLFLVWHDVKSAQTTSDPGKSLSMALTKIQQVIDKLPPELRWRGGLSRLPIATEGHDVQIANIFITSLYIRSNLLQRLGTVETSRLEHQRIVDDLLEILYHLPQPILEANGRSLVPKIRDIGANYLEQLTTDVEVRPEDAEQAKSKIDGILRRLNDLDKWQCGQGSDL
ncbi:hypothetical protein EDB80DRAFT_724067 [Ilyonectria destructans]|nr:hypothetical protein EDB80DRAFT_724067 [Ilyonectria destructans]